MNAATKVKSVPTSTPASTPTPVATDITTITPRKIRILKIAQCPNLSESAQLIYFIGISDSNEILLKVDGNSSSGYWSKEWLDFFSIQKIFAGVSAECAITSFTLQPLFKGKSTNSPGFMLAALLAEGLVQRSSVNDRGYECTDGKEFFSAIQELIDSGVSLDPDAKPKKMPKKKVASDVAASTPALPPAVE